MKHPVFFDPTLRRAPRLKRFFWLGTFLLTIGLVVFALSLYLHPILPLPQIFHDVTTHAGFHPTHHIPSTQVSPTRRQRHDIAYTGALAPNDRRVYTFGVEWDDASFASLEQNKENIDTLIMEELTLSPDGMQILSPDKLNRTTTYLDKNDPDLPVYALINNYNQSTNIWDSHLLHQILSDDTHRHVLEDSLRHFVLDHHFRGINIDFEEIDTETMPYYLTFLSEIGSLIHSDGLILSVNVPLANDSFDLAEIGSRVDLIFLMAYDEHWSSAAPGPIASEDWIIDGVMTAMREADPHKLIVTLGNYGYDWTIGKKQSTALTFQEAHTIMRESEENITFDTESLNPMYTYADDTNQDHEVWYLDAVTAYNTLRSLDALGIGNVSLWRMGSEDPSIWNILHTSATSLDSSRIQDFSYGYDIDYEGTGEFYRLQSEPVLGKRTISLSGAIIQDESITTFPLPYTIARYGDIQDKKVSLTFDDGPDPRITPQILDILKKEQVPSTFFIIGESAEKYPSIVHRIYDEGHVIGNHSFSHPDISQIGHTRIDLELISTERIIESIIGHQTMLWRPPYGEDIEPETPSQVSPLIEAKRLGYITVGMKVDPNDWANPGVQRIVDGVLDQIKAGRGNIVLMHDAGGDRSETLQALPIIIDQLKKLGYQFVSVDTLLGVPRDTLMPAVVGNDALFTKFNHISFSLMVGAMWVIYYVFIATLIFGILRLLIVVLFALLQKYQSRHREFALPIVPLTVSVIVPAYNEASVISKTLDSLLQNQYPYFDIIVVDDGSIDGTSEVVREQYMSEKKIQLHTRPNAGKGVSINYGITHTDADIVIIIDADTILSSDAIGLLARHFTDSGVGAVAGNVVVGNRVNLLTRLQALEYNTSQNLDRRAYDVLNTITVVPGAVGAWRRSIVLELGGFSPDTLAEDSDMTIAMLRAGYRIHHEELAYAYTEVPMTWTDFAKQRFRWAFGLLQVTWKHIDTIFSRDTPLLLRCFIFPSFFIFQIIVPIVAPLFDIFTIAMLVINMISYGLYGSSIYLGSLGHLLAYSLVFLSIDLIIAIIAIACERNERWTLLYYFLPQRILYRFFMYYINIRALWNGLRGGHTGWNKLHRTGGVDISDKNI